MQYWDNVLYPPFLATIRGEYYNIITQDMLDEECYYLACRAISAFKFPKISTQYETFYGIRQEDNSIKEVDKDEDNAIPHGFFLNELTYNEIEIIIAWMKVYWCENQISNADNFEDIYTDTNIKTFSRANLIDKTASLLKSYRQDAKELENRYSRVNSLGTAALGDINE